MQTTRLFHNVVVKIISPYNLEVDEDQKLSFAFTGLTLPWPLTMTMAAIDPSPPLAMMASITTTTVTSSIAHPADFLEAVIKQGNNTADTLYRAPSDNTTDELFRLLFVTVRMNKERITFIQTESN